MDVDLPAHLKGTHMSRFVEALHARDAVFDPLCAVAIVVELRERLTSERAHVLLEFPFFIERRAPVTGLPALADFDATLQATIARDAIALEVGARIPVTSLCPCSKEIRDYGAHSQRGYVTLTVECDAEQPVWLEDLFEIGEAAGSAPIYPLLKRPDERFVTMQAYDNPAFVEDIARSAAAALRADERVLAYRIEASNQESIHNHSAVARLRWERP